MEARKIEFESVEWIDSEEIAQESIQTPAIDKVSLIVAPEQKDIDDLFFFAQVAIEGILTVILSYVLLLFFTTLPVFVAIFLAFAASFLVIKSSKYLYHRLKEKHK